MVSTMGTKYPTPKLLTPNAKFHIFSAKPPISQHLGDFQPQTPNSKLQTPNSKPQTTNN